MSNSSVEYRMILERDEAVATRVRAEKDNELLRVQLKATDDARKSERETVEKLKRHLTTRSRERDMAEERALLHERERDEAVTDAANARGEAGDMRDAMRQSRDAFENLRKAHAMVLGDRDNVARQRDEAREAFGIVTKSTSETIETLRRELSEAIEARDLWHTEAGVLREKMSEKLSEAIEARDLMARQVMHERELHADALRDERATCDLWRTEAGVLREKLRRGRAAAGTAVGVKRLWLVRRTDAAGKPGEYGKVIVWAADGTDAVDVVMWAGYEGNPMYGYRDRAHTTVVALEYGDEADDQVVVAETLR